MTTTQLQGEVWGVSMDISIEVCHKSLMETFFFFTFTVSTCDILGHVTSSLPSKKKKKCYLWMEEKTEYFNSISSNESHTYYCWQQTTMKCRFILGIRKGNDGEKNGKAVQLVQLFQPITGGLLVYDAHKKAHKKITNWFQIKPSDSIIEFFPQISSQKASKKILF